MDIKEMYGLLTRMPLLMGISGQDLARMEEHMKLQVENLHASDYPVIKQGQICTQLFFLVSGEMKKVHISSDGLYSVCERVKGPAVIEAENLYGLHCLYESSYIPLTECKTLRISKSDVGTHLMKIEIFRMNYVNRLSAQISKLRSITAYESLKSAEEKIISFIQRNITTTEPEKLIQIKMTDLAAYLDETRLSVSQVLNRLEKSGLITLRRKEIYIPDIQKITDYNQ